MILLQFILFFLVINYSIIIFFYLRMKDLVYNILFLKKDDII